MEETLPKRLRFRSALVNGRGRLRIATPQRPVPFPGQGPPFGLPLLFVRDIYISPERGAWGIWNSTPSMGQTKFIFFFISAETCLRISSRYSCALSPEYPVSLFPIPCVLPPGPKWLGEGLSWVWGWSCLRAKRRGAHPKHSSACPFLMTAKHSESTY